MRFLLLTLTSLSLFAPHSLGVIAQFSLDRGSPSINGLVDASDLLKVGESGLEIVFQGADLGLQAGDNLDAATYGEDWISIGQESFNLSVQNGTAGFDGGTIYRSADSTTSVLYTEANLNLALGDDVNALTLEPVGGAGQLYFSVDSDSTSLDADDIFLNTVGSLFADGLTDIGLLPGDDIDGIVLDDSYEPGVLNPGIDRGLFSLNRDSPSTFTLSGNPYSAGVSGALSPSDILFTDFTGDYSLYRSAQDVGLDPSFETDALTTPEPGTFPIWLIFSLCFGYVRSAINRRPNA